MSNGSYAFADDGNTTAVDSSGTPGTEIGPYKFDASTGSLATGCATVNSDGEWGFSNGVAGGGSQYNASFSVDGNTMTLTGPEVTGSIVVTKVVSDPTNPIIGSWITSNSTVQRSFVITFLKDGSYLIADGGDPADPQNPAGIEVGTYSFNTSTKAFTSNCPSIHTDGDNGGLVNNWGTSTCSGTNASISFTSDGNTMTFTASDGAHVLNRVN